MIRLDLILRNSEFWSAALILFMGRIEVIDLTKLFLKFINYSCAQLPIGWSDLGHMYWLVYTRKSFCLVSYWLSRLLQAIAGQMKPRVVFLSNSMQDENTDENTHSLYVRLLLLFKFKFLPADTTNSTKQESKLCLQILSLLLFYYYNY